MKNLLISIFILFSACGFSQNRKQYRKYYIDSIYRSANDSLKINNIEKAYYLYTHGYRFFNKSQLKSAEKKIDSLRPILRKKLLENISGKWNLMSSQYETKIKSIEIFNDKIMFNEKDDIKRIEKIVFEDENKSIKNYSEIIFSDNTKWNLKLENGYLVLEYVSFKTQKGEITYTDNNEEYIFKK